MDGDKEAKEKEAGPVYNIVEYPTPVGEVEYTCGDL